jgi:kinesin family protein 4/21/27
VSYLEIYNEMCVDLLVPSAAASRALEIKEHPQLGVHVKGLTEVPVRARADLMKLAADGGARRVTGETQMNARSSRSHAIMTLHIRQQRLVPPVHCGGGLEDGNGCAVDGSNGGGRSGIGDGGGEARKLEVSAKINLVDLAGSERAAKTGAEGQRLKEGIQINQVLPVLTLR